MFKYHKTLNLIVIAILLFTSCSDQQSDLLQETSELRATFLTGKEYRQVKTDYSSLKDSAKNDLWIEKLNQLKGLHLSPNHDNLIDNLTQQLKDDSSDLEKISLLAVELAKITPEYDFLMMFGSLEDYSPKNNGGFHDNVISIDLQENLLKLGSLEKKKNINITGSSPDCNCSWTCDWYNNGYSNTNCNETTTGCGFLWLQSCEEVV